MTSEPIKSTCKGCGEIFLGRRAEYCGMDCEVATELAPPVSPAALTAAAQGLAASAIIESAAAAFPNDDAVQLVAETNRAGASLTDWRELYAALALKAPEAQR